MHTSVITVIVNLVAVYGSRLCINTYIHKGMKIEQ